MNCDMDGDSYISDCEMFDCMVIVENYWRDANCPRCPDRLGSCSNRPTDCCTCEVAKSCDYLY